MPDYLLTSGILVVVLFALYYIFAHAASKIELLKQTDSGLETRLGAPKHKPNYEKEFGFYNFMAFLSLFFALTVVLAVVFLSGFSTEQIVTASNYTYANYSFNGANYSVQATASTISYNQPTQGVSNVMVGIGFLTALYIVILLVWLILHFIGSTFLKMEGQV